MSDAVTRAKKLLDDVTRLKRQKTERHNADHFEKRKNELRSLRTKLDESVVPALVLARRRQVKLPRAHEQKAEKLKTDLVEILRRARDEAPDAMTRGKDYSRFRDGVSQFAELMNKVVDDAWAAFRADLPEIKAVPLGEIEQIPGQAESVESVRLLDQVVKKQAKQPPRSDQEYDALVVQVEALRAQVDQLSENSFPPAVRRFVLEALHPTGADMSLLTEEVRSWLEQRKLLARVRLRLINNDALTSGPVGRGTGGGKKQ